MFTSLKWLNHFLLCFCLICSILNAPALCSVNRFLSKTNKLNYDPIRIPTRQKRDIHNPTPVELSFESNHRPFNLVLYPAGHSVFADGHSSLQDAKDADLDSFLFEGHLKDDPKSHVYGSIIDGLFDGHIHTGNNQLYHVEKAVRYYKTTPKQFHSIIYEDSDIDYNRLRVKRQLLPPKFETVEGDDLPAAPHCGLFGRTEKNMDILQHHADPTSVNNNNDQHTIRDNYINHFDREPMLNRYKRQNNQRLDTKYVNGKKIYGVRMCSLYLQADHKLYAEIYAHEGQKSDQRTREEILSMFYSHVKAVNKIYESTSFGGIEGVNFIVQRTTIYNTSSCNPDGTKRPGADNPFCADNVDVSNYLNLNSISNHSSFCLAYSLTYRDFVGGTLGLAWVASPQANTAGGICQIYQRYNERRGWVWRSLNTGIITLVNYGHRVPARVSQLTLAHEIGHNFGSPHDFPAYCQPGKSQGNYIMYASATSGDKDNNEKFSECSKANISAVLFAVLAETPVDPQKLLLGSTGGKRNCFSARTSAFCGNGIVEPGEECDCGFTEADCQRMRDPCCYPHKTNESGGVGCKRKPTARCSPSEGPCCNSNTCNFKNSAEQCSQADECNRKQSCNGFQPKCPPPPPLADNNRCEENTKICRQGFCNTSICELVGLKECFLTEGSPHDLCQIACRTNAPDAECVSSFKLASLRPYYQDLNLEQDLGGVHMTSQGIMRRPGSPCNDYQGYCDIFRKCRSVDSNGPLSRLRNFILNPEVYDDLREWVERNWWAVVLIGMFVVLLMALFIKCCAVHTPSTNPNKPPAHNIYETLRHPSTLMRPERRRRRAAQNTNGNAPATQGQQPAPSNRERSAARNRADRHRHRHRRSSADPQQQPAAPSAQVAMQQMPVVPPSEPPPPYLAAVSGNDVVISVNVPPGGPKRGHRKHRSKAAPSASGPPAPKRT